MTWLKVDDGTWMEPWVEAAGNEAFGIHTRLASYSAQYLTDGLVPANVAAMISRGNEDALATLERLGKIARLETGAVVLPDFLEHNPSRAQTEADREARSEAGRAAARARWAQNGGRRRPRRKDA